MEGGFLDMMGSILGNNISNEIYFVYGLIAVVLILIVVILVMDHQAKRRLHKNLFNNKVLRKNLKHLEETGELPVVAPKKKEEKPFIFSRVSSTSQKGICRFYSFYTKSFCFYE